MICPACNHKFDPESSSVGCGACLMHGSCGLVKCPECGYETPREPGFLARLFQSFSRPSATEVAPDQHCLVEDSATRAARGMDEPAPSAPNASAVGVLQSTLAPVAQASPAGTTLASLRQGDTAFIERFAAPQHARKFLSLGILPGTSVTVLKQFPAIVLRVGYSEFAFDRKLASTVIVRR
ncbi:hypothetical protein CVU37_09185 [candidate division BRC1 bacterium HGW-BRC1-1]|nr:MAG: hypothetical protein CVU37_09185 [candidate division BRC1 bacterium HGW-BRC1-1]